MVHTLVPMSVKIKIKNFETPARLINHMELSCAVGMACRQASLPCPEGTAGTDLKEFVKSVPDTIYSSSAVDEKLKVLIRDYIYKKGEVLDDDSLVTLKLGYENTEVSVRIPNHHALRSKSGSQERSLQLWILHQQNFQPLEFLKKNSLIR